MPTSTPCSTHRLPSDELPDTTTVVAMCMRRALVDGDRPGYVFETDDEQAPQQLTFGELDRRARAVAATLREHAEPGARALLNYPAGLDFLTAFFGCLYAGVIAVPAAPIERTRPDSALARRCRSIVDSAQPALLLSTTGTLAQIREETMGTSGLHALHPIATDAVDDHAADGWTAPEIDSGTIAYLQYSSGSTGTPKGVMLTHGNVLHNVAAIRSLCADGPEVAGAFWLPMFHDMGLVSSALMPVMTGGWATLMSPVAFLQQPYRWLAALDRPHSTTAAPNFAYDLCVRRVSDRQLATLDLSGWECAIVGAERVRAETLRRFADRFSTCGFRAESFAPCYGLAESTLLVSGGPTGRRPEPRRFAVDALARDRTVEPAPGEPAVELVGSGVARPGVRVVIVEPDTRRPAAPGRVGEICVESPSIGLGYWNRPEESAATFGVTLPDVEGEFLRTGDLGVILDGELFVTGRRKDVVIVDGYNHYPPDLEATAESAHPATQPGFCAVVSIDDGSRERLVVLAELTTRTVLALNAEDHDTDESAAQLIPTITAAIRRALSAGHGVAVDDVVLLRPGSLPVTSSGKLQRFACRSTYAAGGFVPRRLTAPDPAPRPSLREAA
jgi:acyl-CoA synthetase (AMP-forming)/AMP-acid ligase II